MGYEVRANLDLSISYFNAKSSILPHCQCCRSESSIVVCNVRLILESCIKKSGRKGHGFGQNPPHGSNPALALFYYSFKLNGAGSWVDSISTVRPLAFPYRGHILVIQEYGLRLGLSSQSECIFLVHPLSVIFVSIPTDSD